MAVVGIDVGTSNSAAAVLRGGRPVMIPSAEGVSLGGKAFPKCVASGAAIQAGSITGEVGEIVLVDVTPLTLGVETLGGVATPLIARNTPVPVRKTESFTTAADMQTSVTVHVLQGERPMATDDTSLGQSTATRSTSRSP